MNVVDIADEIYRELGEPDDISIPSVSFWITTNIGKLNNLLDTDYAIVNSEIEPNLGESEKTILKLIYMIYYFNRQVNKNLGAAAYNSVLELREGNRTVKVANKNDIAKNYRTVIADYNDELMTQLLNYKMNRSDPHQFVVGNPILTDEYGLIESSRRAGVVEI